MFYRMNGIKHMEEQMEKFSEINRQPVVLCSPQIRPHLKRFVERFLPDLAVLSYNELESSTRIQAIGTVKV